MRSQCRIFSELVFGTCFFMLYFSLLSFIFTHFCYNIYLMAALCAMCCDAFSMKVFLLRLITLIFCYLCVFHFFFLYKVCSLVFFFFILSV